MSVLLDLPTDVIVSVLTEWLGLDHSVKIDLAIDSKQRLFLNEALQGLNRKLFPKLRKSTEVINVGLYIWMSKKQIIFVDLILSDFCFDNDFNLKWTIDTENTQRLSLELESTDERMIAALTGVVNSCTKLTYIASNGVPSMDTIKPEVLHTLVGIRLDPAIHNTSRTLSPLVTHCRNLKMINISGADYDADIYFQDIIKNNKSTLDIIKLKAKMSVLDTIAEHCEVITQVEITGYEETIGVYPFLVAKPDLESFLFKRINYRIAGLMIDQAVQYRLTETGRELEIQTPDHPQFALLPVPTNLAKFLIDVAMVDLAPCWKFIMPSLLSAYWIVLGKVAMTTAIFKQLISLPALQYLDVTFHSNVEVVSAFKEVQPSHIKSMQLLGLKLTNAQMVIDIITSCEGLEVISLPAVKKTPALAKVLSERPNLRVVFQPTKGR